MTYWEEARNGHPSLAQATWFKSSRSENTAGCAEIAHTDEITVVRNSKNPDASVLTFTLHEWECFLDGASKGEFNRPQLNGACHEVTPRGGEAPRPRGSTSGDPRR